MPRYPILISCIAFVLGILFQDALSCDRMWIYLLVATAFILSLASLKIYVRYISIVFISILFFGLGAFSLSLRQGRDILPLQKDEIITFILDKKLNSNLKNKRYEVIILDKSRPIKATLSIPKDFPELDYTHYYRGKGFINRIKKPEHSYQFDYSKYMSRREIYYQIYLSNAFEHAERNYLSPTEKIKQYRLNVLRKIDKSQLPKANKELLKGIILADRTEIDEATNDDFTRTGLVHILAISGSHMVIIFGLAYFLLSQIWLLSKRWRVLLSLAFIWAFTVFIDYGSSVVRSSIMISIYYIYVLLKRKPDLLQSVSLSALFILGFNPHQLFDVGFQLSFSAVLGIYWLNRPIAKLFPKVDSKIYQYFSSIISITLSAQIATLPLVLYYFHQFPLISLVSNIFAIPLAEVVIIYSVFMAIFIGLGFEILWLEKGYDLISSLFLNTVHFFAGFDTLLIEQIPMNIIEAVFLGITIYFLRSLLINFNAKNSIWIGFSVLIFLSLRFTFNILAYNTDEFLVHKHYRKNIFSIKNNNKIIFYIPEDGDSAQIKKYILLPYSIHSRTKNIECKTYGKEVNKILYNKTLYDTQNTD